MGVPLEEMEEQEEQEQLQEPEEPMGQEVRMATAGPGAMERMATAEPQEVRMATAEVVQVVLPLLQGVSYMQCRHSP